MKSVNYALRKAYLTSLNGLTVNSVAVPVYYLQAPESVTVANYIIISDVANVDVGTKNSSDTNTSIQLRIETWAEGGNAGKMADDIAGAIYALIYPNSQAVLNLIADGFQMVSTKVSDDRVLDGEFGNRDFITRVITFRHYIYHK